ncbi:MAG: hypothetical protein HYW69_01335 [Candidatus Nealsonbacteria bacterium]|nr:hypothetical protein [Candidatus Nealsonbacteria bacterium]
MDCKRARELVLKHIVFLATLEGEKVATKEEILAAFSHVKCCPDWLCLQVWHVVFHASMELPRIKKEIADLKNKTDGWDGEY